MRLIDADALITWFNNHYDDEQVTVGFVSGLIKEQPTIEPERKMGKWIYLKNKNGTILALRCSVCGKSPKHAIRSDYCPNCGADMRERSEDVH